MAAHPILLLYNMETCAVGGGEKHWSHNKLFVYEYLWLKWSVTNSLNKQQLWRWTEKTKWEESKLRLSCSLRRYRVRSVIMYNLWLLPVLKLVPCWPVWTISNCELIKSKQSSGSVPVAPGQTDFIQGSTKQCVRFCDIFLVFLCFLGSSMAEKLFETSNDSCWQQVWDCQIKRRKALQWQCVGQIL